MIATFSKSIIIGTFYANQDYIAAYLCQNRDKPELNCDGKCILAEKLKAAEETSEEGIPSSLRELIELGWFAYGFDFLSKTGNNEYQKYQSFYQLIPYCTYLSVLIPPPKSERNYTTHLIIF